MRHRIGLTIAPGREVGAHHRGIGPLTFQIGDVVVLQYHLDRRSDVALEGQVDVAGRHHQRAVDGPALRKAHDDAAGPVRQRSRLVGPAPNADSGGAGHVDVKIAAGFRSHAHALGPTQHLGSRPHPLLQRGIRHQAFERFGMFVGYHKNACASLQYLWCLDRVHQAFDGAIDDKTRLL
jgi:hypothetical protein